MESKLYLLALSKFQALNPTLQKEIYQEFYRLMYGSIIYMVKDHASTEDVIQISFLKVVRNVPNFDDRSKLYNWMRVVVKNTVLTFLRKHKNIRNQTDLDGVYFNESADSTTVVESVEYEIELKAMTDTVAECLNNIKPDYKAIIELRWKQQLTYKEIADQLEIDEDTVKSKLHRAREALKKKFLQKWGEQSDGRPIRK